MNKKLIILIVITIIIALSSIGFLYLNSNNKSSNDNNSNNNSNTNINENNNINSNIAIIYFSATGTTKEVAKYLEEATNGELIEIIPKEEYTSADLNYSSEDCRASKEQNDPSARPEISNNINTDSYDVIYLGYPIWFGDAPKIILTFLDSHDLSGKIVIPFCTSGSSSIGTSLNYFKSHYENINWLDGRRLSTSKSEVINWVNELNY